MEQIPAGNLEFVVGVRDGRTGDGGPSILVRTTIDGAEVQLLRFDCFRERPHYHYAPGGANTSYDIDPTLFSDSLGWVIAQLGASLGPMVERAGFPAVAEGIDREAVATGLAKVEAHFASEALAAS
ncbi:MAG: hypothetical protein IIC95_09900 [Chloroflexi bacterium]|nr:hypothetical protein [Chloroflexota bacterium]MCH7656275.1 hypothetical protein [Chloroflexota bacterium]